MKNKLFISVVTASLLFSTSLLFANSDNLHDSVADKETKALNHPSKVQGKAAAQAQVEEAQSKELFLSKQNRKAFKTQSQKDEFNRLKKIVNNEYTRYKHESKKASQELTDGLTQIFISLNALQADKTEEAKIALQKAIDLFNTAFKHHPNLKLISVAQEVVVKNFEGDSKLVQTVKDKVIQSLKNNDTQLAIELLNPLQDEIIMTKKVIPVDIYPATAKKALEYLNKGKNDLAFQSLVTVLNTTVIETTVLPIPLLTAQSLVVEASTLDKSNKKEVTVLLNSAQDELKKSVQLGYTKAYSKEYKAIDNEITQLRKEVKGKNAVVKLYEHIKESFTALMSKHKADVDKSSK